jgi:hypothetical protein
VSTRQFEFNQRIDLPDTVAAGVSNDSIMEE